MRTLILSLAVLTSVTLQAQTTFQRGDVVRVKPSTTSQPLTYPLHVIAVGGDKVRLDDSGIYVNDVVVTGFSDHFIKSTRSQPDRVPQTVPEGHYFVFGEMRANQDVSQYWGVQPVSSLEPVIR
jgi:signal peptidase I